MVELTHRNEEQTFEDICLHANDFHVRQITLKDLFQSLREGYEDYGTKPSSIPLLFLFYALFALVLTLFALGQDMRYLLFPMAAGFTMIGPIAAIAFFAMSKRREQGQELRWRAAFNFIHTSSFAPILALTLLMSLLYLSWLFMAELIFFSLFESTMPTSMADFVNQLFNTRHGGALIAYGNFVGLLFAFAAMALSIVAFPLALDKTVTSFTAVRVSIRAFMSNTLVLTVWGIIFVALMAVGAAVFLIGLAVALPVLGHATWHLYRKLIVS
tara:strand:- start:622 stop:1434 length:813 start_codon:yes stop_codon:yes gene_type:complete